MYHLLERQNNIKASKRFFNKFRAVEIRELILQNQWVELLIVFINKKEHQLHKQWRSSMISSNIIQETED